MDFDRSFTVTLDDGRAVLASVIINFEYMDNKYCIYSMDSKNGVGIYCAKNIEGQLIKITNREEIEFVNTVVEKIVSTVEER